MNIFSLGIALLSGYFLIPAFGLVGAALSMLSYNLVSMIWNNAYLAKLGLWPYSRKLWTQLAWMAALLALYIAMNSGWLSMDIPQKVILYSVVLVALGLQWMLQKRRSA